MKQLSPPLGLLLGVLLCCACAPARTAQVTFSVPEVVGVADTVVDVPICVDAGRGLGAMQIDFLYDSTILLPQVVEAGPVLPALVDHNIVRPGRLRIAMASSQAASGDGAILIVRCRVLSNDVCDLKLENGRAWALADSTDLAVSLRPGCFRAHRPDWARSPVTWVSGIGAGVVLMAVLLARARRRQARRPGGGEWSNDGGRRTGG